MTARIGIDFGTANTVVALWDEQMGRGEPVILEGLDVLREGAVGVQQRVIPSLVAYRGEDRFIGAQVHAHDSELTASDSLRFRNMKSQVTGRAIDVPTYLGTRSHTGRQAATDFLIDVMNAGLLAVGDPDAEVILTAPVESFDVYHDWLVSDVADRIGTERVRIVDEATAAAVGYSARMQPGDVFMVFDFGAGTLDVSIVRIQEPTASGSSVRSIAKRGAELGGTHIDGILAEYVIEKASLPLGNEDALSRIRGPLVSECEAAKVALSKGRSAIVHLNHPITSEPVEVSLDRGEFDDILDRSGVIQKVSRTLRAAIEDASERGYPASSIRNVFLVGGTSLIPAVQKVVRLYFDSDVVHLDRPLEAVAAGAASIAGGIELFDHIQHDYAIRHVSAATGAYEYSVLVKAGTEYPTENSVAKFTMRAIHEGQRHLGIAIYEIAHASFRETASEVEIVFDPSGSARAIAYTAQRQTERSMVWLNEKSPTFLEAVPPAHAGHERFQVEFRVDEKKRLTVSAFDLHRRIWVLDHQPVVKLA